MTIVPSILQNKKDTINPVAVAVVVVVVRMTPIQPILMMELGGSSNSSIIDECVNRDDAPDETLLLLLKSTTVPGLMSAGGVSIRIRGEDVGLNDGVVVVTSFMEGAMEGGKVVTVTVGALEGDKVVAVTVVGMEDGDEDAIVVVGDTVVTAKVGTAVVVVTMGANVVAEEGALVGDLGAIGAAIVGVCCAMTGAKGSWLLGALVGDRMGATIVGGGRVTVTTGANVGGGGVTPGVVGDGGVTATIGATVGGLLLFRVGWTGTTIGVATTGCRTIIGGPADGDGSTRVSVGAEGMTAAALGVNGVVVGDGRGGVGAGSSTGANVGVVVVGDSVISRSSVSALANNRI
jgi:hypothetical protein